MVKKLVMAGATSVLQQGASLKEAAVFLSDLLQSKADQDAQAVREEGDNAAPRTVNIFVPPYDHQFVWSGNGTLAWEIATQMAIMDGVDVYKAAASLDISAPAYSTAPLPSCQIPDPVDLDTPPAEAVAASMAVTPPAAILCSVGGGGLMNGLVEGLDGLEETFVTGPASGRANVNPSDRPTWSATPIIATETSGADSLAASMHAWETARLAVLADPPIGLTPTAATSMICPHPVTLDRITSAATSLGVSRVSERSFAIATGLYNNGGVPLSVEHPTTAGPGLSSNPDSPHLSDSVPTSLTEPSIFSSLHNSAPTSTSVSSASSVSDMHLHESKPPVTSVETASSSSSTTTCLRPLSRRPVNSIKSLVLTDAEAALGCVALADSDRLMVELACGVNVAALFGGRLEKALGRPVRPDESVVVVVCGGSDVSAERLAEWRERYGGVEALLAA